MYFIILSGDAIVVQGRQSSKIYIGALHKVVGTFPLKDTRLFQGSDF